MSNAWMPFYSGDFIKDTLHLSNAEIGSYMLLLFHCWEHKGTVPGDDASLCRIARAWPQHWPRIRKKLEPFFEVQLRPPGSWLHHRVALELTKSAELSNKRKGAAEQMLSKRSANAQQVLTQSQSHKNKKGWPGNGGTGKAVPNVKIGDTMGGYVWNGSRWAEAEADKL